LWRKFSKWFPDEVEAWLAAGGELPPPTRATGIEAMYQDAMWVYQHKAETDRTEAHRTLRRLKDTNFSAFFTLLVRLEGYQMKMRYRRR
jgi:hypothetical protein